MESHSHHSVLLACLIIVTSYTVEYVTPQTAHNNNNNTDASSTKTYTDTSSAETYTPLVHPDFTANRSSDDFESMFVEAEVVVDWPFDNVTLCDLPHNTTASENEWGSFGAIQTTCTNPAEPVNNISDWTESRALTVALDTTVIFECVTHNLSMCPSSNLHYLHFGSLTKQSLLTAYKKILDNTTTIWSMRINKPKHEGDEFTEYKRWISCFCLDQEKMQDTFSIGTALFVHYGLAPQNVSGFRCEVHNFSEAHCRWDDQKDLNVKWEICYGLLHWWAAKELDETWRCEKVNNPYHVWRNVYFNGKYAINITGTNVYGEYVSTIPYTMKKDKHTTVKIMPPFISMTSPATEDRVNITWTMTSIPAHKRIQVASRVNGMIIQYIAVVNQTLTADYEMISEEDRQVIVDVEIHPDMKTPSSKEQVEYYEVRPLLPATHYTVIARQKIGNSQGVWSDNSTLTLQTKPALPSKGPAVNINAFEAVDDSKACEGQPDHRIVTVYWKTLSIHSGGNGELNSYRITYGKPIELAASHRENIFCLPLHDTSLTVAGINDVGLGKPTAITIPAASSLDKSLKKCMITAREVPSEEEQEIRLQEGELNPKQRYVHLDWKALKQYIDSNVAVNVTYTIYWCKLLDNNACVDIFEWIELSDDYVNNHTSHVIKVPGESPHDFKYGVSVHRNGGQSLSGVLWAPCLYGNNPPSPDTDIGFKFDYYNSSHSKLSIQPQCEPGIPKIDSVDINYKCVQTDALFPKNREICYRTQTIPNLSLQCNMSLLVNTPEDAQFDFWLTLTYQGRLAVEKTSAKPYTNLPPTEAPPALAVSEITNENDKKAIIAIIVAVIGLIIIVAVLSVVCYIRRKQRNAKKIIVGVIQPVLDGTMQPEELSDDEGSEVGEDDFFLTYPSSITPVITDPRIDNTNLEIKARQEARLLQHEDLERQHLIHSDISIRQRGPSHQQSVDSDYWTAADDHSGHSSILSRSAYKRAAYQESPTATCDEPFLLCTVNDRENELEADAFFDDGPSVSACLRDLSGDPACDRGKLSLSDFISPDLLTEGGKDKSGGHTQSSGQDLNSYLQVDRISQGDDNSIKSEPCKAKHVLTPEELPGGLPAQLRTPQLQRVKESTPAVFDDDVGSLGSSQELTVSACLDINSGRPGPLFAGKTLQDLLQPSPNTTGDNRVIVEHVPQSQDKENLKTEQFTSDMESMNSSIEHMPGSGYLQVDRISDGEGDQPSPYNSSANIQAKDLAPSLLISQVEETRPTHCHRDYKNLPDGYPVSLPASVRPAIELSDYQAAPLVDDCNMSFTSDSASRDDIDYLLVSGCNDVSV